MNADPAGVELAAAAKNVIALAAGAMDGLRLGTNAKAALITLGLADMRRLGVARAETFAGLAGTGDALVTCWSRHSRNRRAGAFLLDMNASRGFPSHPPTAPRRRAPS